jgi:hypothetical protein
MRTELDLLTNAKHRLLAVETMLKDTQLELRRHYTALNQHSSTFFIQTMNSIFNNEKAIAVLVDVIDDYLNASKNENENENEKESENEKERE